MTRKLNQENKLFCFRVLTLFFVMTNFFLKIFTQVDPAASGSNKILMKEVAKDVVDYRSWEICRWF